MPPHEVYVEPFLGGGAVMRLKRPAALNVGVDLDGAAVQRAANLVRAGEWISCARALPVGCGDVGIRPAAFEFVCGDGVELLRRRRSWRGALVYCDPPYLMATRSSQRRMYRYELEPDRHRELLDVLLDLPALVMVSGYSCPMYDQALSSWRVVRYRVMTRGGRMATECLWCNFPEPVELHDYRYLGRDFRERERIKRKQARWVRRLSEMTVLERQALQSALLAVRTGAGTSQEGAGATISGRVGVGCLPAGVRLAGLPVVAEGGPSESNDGSPGSFWFPGRGA